MKSEATSRGGRPWSFDRDKALETAMRLFWRHGYEGVSLGDLTRAIGVAPPSLYAAFGSKAELYQAALDRYEQTLGALKPATLEDATSMADAVRRLLEAALAAVIDPKRERGCMISSGIVACHPDHAALAQDAAKRRAALRRRLVGALTPFAAADEVERLSRHLAAVMQGLSIQARDGASRAELQDIVEDVVAGVALRFPKKRRRG